MEMFFVPVKRPPQSMFLPGAVPSPIGSWGRAMLRCSWRQEKINSFAMGERKQARCSQIQILGDMQLHIDLGMRSVYGEKFVIKAVQSRRRKKIEQEIPAKSDSRLQRSDQC